MALRRGQTAARRVRFAWRDEFVWELLDGDGAVGEVDLERGVARSAAGSWHIESVGRSLGARPADTGNVIAAYYPRRIRMGGSVVLSEDDWFTLVRNPLSNDCGFWTVIATSCSGLSGASRAGRAGSPPRSSSRS